MDFFSQIYGSWGEIQKEKYEKIIEIIKKNRISMSGKVLDIGCGPFFFEKFLEEKGVNTKNFTCIDTEKQIKDRADRNFIVSGGDKIPLKSLSVSLAFCIDSIHLIESADDIYRVLKAGGFLIVSSFFNSENQAKIEAGLGKKLNRFKILKKTIMKGKENELILLCKKVK